MLQTLLLLSLLEDEEVHVGAMHGKFCCHTAKDKHGEVLCALTCSRSCYRQGRLRMLRERAQGCVERLLALCSPFVTLPVHMKAELFLESGWSAELF